MSNSSSRKSISYVDYNEQDTDPVYCPYCEKVGVKYRLGPRVYEPDHPQPYDADNWLQCYRCGRVIPIYEVKEELDYKPIVEIIESPFESGSEFAGTNDKENKHKKRRRNTKPPEVDKEIAAESGDVNVLYDSTDNY